MNIYKMVEYIPLPAQKLKFCIFRWYYNHASVFFLKNTQSTTCHIYEILNYSLLKLLHMCKNT